MYVVTNAIRVKKGYAPQLVERFKERKGIEQSTGFIRLELLVTEGLEDHDEVRVCTTWENKDSFIAWTKSEAFRKAHEQKDRERLDFVLGNEMFSYKVALSVEA
ncbi:heme oxygenase (staphylobilin-producing) [Anoxybacillus voinovskiensis]|uniref:Heme oxygenase (Staphylobilin-producing) n=1 Tax=Anoxybacteroides voinovskiense TaxID=230470 RepID=A0A840DZ41_9BACL|nr:antibiotic biosynthesis monooxygenase [Anoxybacillus voinovskiensis]MBB4075248.1 heme oxygenase (staphylobilin-producing) [Anoxybacillus voinovskiensis]GGJ77442.1 antibiotic biosynthesis monooxygenase [Anoxybacillus voinovskiensis]